MNVSSSKSQCISHVKILSVNKSTDTRTIGECQCMVGICIILYYIEKERSLKAGILRLGGKSNHTVPYNKAVRKSVLIPRDIVEEEILKRLDEGKSHVIQADIGSYLV